ncbi:MAG: nitroreductase family protein [Desulfatibacillaceae bacterium]
MDFKRVMEERRSIDWFDTNRPVTEHTLRQIVNLAALAPSSFNLQPWHLMVYKSPDARRRLYEAAGKDRKILDAPVVLVVIGDKYGWQIAHPAAEQAWQSFVELGYMNDDLRDWYEQETQALFGSERESTIFAVKNASLFAMSLMLAAKHFDVDSHPLGGFLRDEVAASLGIPPNFIVVMLIAMGHLNKKYRVLPPKWRKSYDEIVLDTM